MVSGVKALMYSADFYPEEEESSPSKFEQWLEKHLSSEKLEKAIVGLAVLLGVGMSIFLFLVLPTLLTGGILHFFPGLSPVGPERGGGPFENCDLSGVSDPLLQAEGHLQGVPVSRGGA